MMAPAAIAGLSSMLTAMPMKPTPMVPTTVQELPMLNATTALIAQAVK